MAIERSLAKNHENKDAIYRCEEPDKPIRERTIFKDIFDKSYSISSEISNPITECVNAPTEI